MRRGVGGSRQEEVFSSYSEQRWGLRAGFSADSTDARLDDSSSGPGRLCASRCSAASRVSARSVPSRSLLPEAWRATVSADIENTPGRPAGPDRASSNSCSVGEEVHFKQMHVSENTNGTRKCVHDYILPFHLTDNDRGHPSTSLNIHCECRFS